MQESQHGLLMTVKVDQRSVLPLLCSHRLSLEVAVTLVCLLRPLQPPSQELKGGTEFPLHSDVDLNSQLKQQERKIYLYSVSTNLQRRTELTFDRRTEVMKEYIDSSLAALVPNVLPETTINRRC